MKKYLSAAICTLLTITVLAQETPEPAKKKKPVINLSNRANDHLMVQFGYAGWSGIPDTINKKGLSKSINVYLMVDYPFKTNPKLSIGVGIGVGSDHITFSKTYVGIKDLTSTIRFTDQSDTTHFKKTKLATSYLEAPVELRFNSNPVTAMGFKFAIGVKIGTMINAHTRNTKLESVSNASLNEYTMKEASKRFFNKNRLSVTGRVGYGHFTLFGSYQVTSLFKDGLGPAIKPYSIGLTLSGL